MTLHERLNAGCQLVRVHTGKFAGKCTGKLIFLTIYYLNESKVQNTVQENKENIEKRNQKLSK